MPDVDWNNPHDRMAHARAARGRAKVLPPMGDERQPTISTVAPSRPIETPNPMLTASEPFSFAPPARPIETLGEGDPRPVVEAEIDELMAWGLPRYQEIYPRCTAESVRPMLILATRGGRTRFLRTKDAASLFIAEVTPWEPELFVYQIFVVARVNNGTSSKEAYRLIRDSRRWAESIGAIGFEFGRARCSANLRDGADFLKRLSVIVPGQKNESWVKILRPPRIEPAEIAPGARMAAMGMEASG